MSTIPTDIAVAKAVSIQATVRTKLPRSSPTMRDRRPDGLDCVFFLRDMFDSDLLAIKAPSSASVSYTASSARFSCGEAATDHLSLRGTTCTAAWRNPDNSYSRTGPSHSESRGFICTSRLGDLEFPCQGKAPLAPGQNGRSA